MIENVDITNKIPKDRWKDVDIIAVDIETDTNDPLGDDGLTGYGLSYVADITDVALLDVTGNKAIVFNKPTKKQQKFIAELLGRDKITIIAHNAIFDLRSLGGHYGFTVARHSLVWDTQTVGVRMLMGDKQGRGFRLEPMSTRLGILKEGTKFSEFVSAMKEKRANLSGLVEDLKTLESSDILWEMAGGYVPPNEEDMLKKASSTLISKYVLSDTVLCAEVYKLQKDVAERLNYKHVRIGHWYHVPVWKALKESLDFWLRGLRVSANQAIKGIRFDSKYADKIIDQCQAVIDDYVGSNKNSLSITKHKDPTDPFPTFNEVLSTLYYYKRVLDICHDTKNKYSKPDGWKFWKFVKLSKDVIRKAMVPGLEDHVYDEWIDFLLNINHDEITRGRILKGHPRIVSSESVETVYNDETQEEEEIVTVEYHPVPLIDLEKYVEDISFKGKYGSSFLAKVKTDWWISFYTATKSDDPNIAKMMNKKSFKPYFLFVISGLDLPSAELLKEFPRVLLTPKGFDKIRDDLKNDDAVIDPLYYMDGGFLSFGKNALTVYTTGMEEGDPRIDTTTSYKNYVEAKDKLSIVTELKLHARRDGRIHSVVAPNTRTGRDTSSGPNLQNMNMEEMRGLLIAEIGKVLMELDASNAENVMLAGISGDDALASATESGDFHSKMAAVYFGEEWKEADSKKRKYLRSIGKTFTFGIAYGMGGLSMQLGLREKGTIMSMGDIYNIIETRERAYPNVARKNQQMKKDCADRLRHGFKPAYIPLYSGERVQVPHGFDQYGKDSGPEYRKISNYAPQGGVATVIHRGQTESQEWLEDNNFKTRIAIDIHDSHIMEADLGEVNETIPMAAKFIGSQLPEDFCRRTTPRIHMVSSCGPENAVKWGYVDGGEYPLPLDKFYNQWGCHDMPEGEKEAPTWRGPIHEGWTLEKETAEIKASMESDDEWKGQVSVTKRKISDRPKFIEQPTMEDLTKAIKKLASVEKEGYSLEIPNDSGQAEKVDIKFSEINKSLMELAKKGHTIPVDSIIGDLKILVAMLGFGIKALERKKDDIERLYNELPNQQQSSDSAPAGESTGDEKQKGTGGPKGWNGVPQKQQSSKAIHKRSTSKPKEAGVRPGV